MVQQSVAVNAAANRIEITHEELHDGFDMGGRLVFDRANLAWVLDQVNRALSDYFFEKVEESRDDDTLVVFVGGHEQDPYLHLQNERDPSAADGGVFAIALPFELAKQLAQELAAL